MSCAEFLGFRFHLEEHGPELRRLRDIGAVWLRGYSPKGDGGISPSVLQTATCATFSHLFGNVISVDEMIERIERGVRPKLRFGE